MKVCRDVNCLCHAQSRWSQTWRVGITEVSEDRAVGQRRRKRAEREKNREAR